MFKRIINTIFIIIVITSPVWAQYQEDDTVININDGEIAISADDFYRHLDGAAGSDPTAGAGVDLSTFDKALDFAEDIVKARAIVAEATKRGYPDEETAGKIREMADGELRDAASARINEMIEVPDAEIDKYYAGMDHQLKVAIIIVTEEKLSRELYDRLLEGEDFGELAAEHHIDDRLKESRGELPSPIKYNLDPTIAAAFDLEQPGDFTEPMSLPTGYWLIVNLIERVDAFNEENPKPDLESVKGWIASKYKESEYPEFQSRILDDDLSQIEIQRDEELYLKGLTWDRGKVAEELYGKDLVLTRVGEYELRFDDWWPKSQFDNTADDDWEEMRNTPEGDQVKRHLEHRYNQNLDDIRLVVWAREKGIDEEKDVAWDIWRQSSERTLDNFTEKELVPILPHPSDEEVRTYFDEHIENYFKKETLSGWLYAFPTEKEANDYRAIADEYVPVNNIAPDELIVKIIEDYGFEFGTDEAQEKLNEIYVVYNVSRQPEEDLRFNPDVSEELADNIIEIALDVETHIYSPVHELSDGRFAFFWNRYYTPFQWLDFDEVEDRIYSELNKEIMASEETGAMIDGWINEMMSKYTFEINEDIAGAVYEKWVTDAGSE